MITAKEALAIYEDSKERKDKVLSEIEKEIKEKAVSQRFCFYNFNYCSEELRKRIIEDLILAKFTVTKDSEHSIKIEF